jgi:hypothetical protein
MLSHFLRAARKPTPANIITTFQQTAVSTTDATTYTFTSQNIGTAFSGRVVVVGISAFSSPASVFSSVTIGGVTATLLSEGFAGSTAAQAAIYALRVDTGTTADIVVNFTATKSNCGIAIWTLENATGFSTQTFQTVTTFTGASVTNTFPVVTANDAIIVMARIRSANVGTYTLTGVTENFESVVETGVSAQLGGFTDISADATNYDVTIASSGSFPNTNYCIVRFFFS